MNSGAANLTMESGMCIVPETTVLECKEDSSSHEPTLLCSSQKQTETGMVTVVPASTTTTTKTTTTATAATTTTIPEITTDIRELRTKLVVPDQTDLSTHLLILTLIFVDTGNRGVFSNEERKILLKRTQELVQTPINAVPADAPLNKMGSQLLTVIRQVPFLLLLNSAGVKPRSL